MIKILIADDHPVVRQGLKQILSEEPDMGNLGEAQNSQEVLELVRKQDWDIVILDITMPGRGGLDVLKELKHERPKLPVLILSVHPEDQYAVRALRAHASGYMTKDSAPEELVKAIRKILGGGKYISSTLAERLAFDLESGTEKPLHETLSDREHQVMVMMTSGKTVSEIAEEMSLSVKTISTYRTRILEKMGMKTNSELMHYAIKNKLVD
jgi:DNA-binding NarL/FixJ family response regulator